MTQALSGGVGALHIKEGAKDRLPPTAYEKQRGQAARRRHRTLCVRAHLKDVLLALISGCAVTGRASGVVALWVQVDVARTGSCLSVVSLMLRSCIRPQSRC